MVKKKCCNNDCKTPEEFLENHMPHDGGELMAPSFVHICKDPECELCYPHDGDYERTEIWG